MYAGNMANPHGLNAAATPAPNANPRGAIIPRSLKNPPKLPDRPSTNRLTPSIPLSLLSSSAPTKAMARAAAATRLGNRTLLTNVLPSENAVVTFMESPSSHSPIDSHLQLRCSRVRPRFRAFSLSINSPVIPTDPNCHPKRPLPFRSRSISLPSDISPNQSNPEIT